MNGWVSPALGIRFEIDANGWTIYHPDGTPFTSHLDLARLRHKAEQNRAIAEYERQRADTEKTAALKVAADQAAEIARLRELLKLQ